MRACDSWAEHVVLHPATTPRIKPVHQFAVLGGGAIRGGAVTAGVFIGGGAIVETGVRGGAVTAGVFIGGGAIVETEL